VTIILPPTGWRGLGLRDVWPARELLYFLVWRDVKVRYRQTILGAAWAILQPAITMVIFAIVFGRLAGVPSDGVPYPLFAFAGLVPWTYVSTGTGEAAASLVGSQNLIKKVWFPRQVLPVAGVLSGLVDLGLAFAVLVILMVGYGVLPSLAGLAVIPLLVLATMTALGPGLWLAALNARYRDVRHVLPFLLQVWLFITPVAYPASLIGEPWRTLYALNPMVGVVEGMRWALLGTPAPSLVTIGLAIAVSSVVLVIGATAFRRAEGTFADVV
jgi:lipopolysaccharide transport system permease protein